MPGGRSKGAERPRPRVEAGRVRSGGMRQAGRLGSGRGHVEASWLGWGIRALEVWRVNRTHALQPAGDREGTNTAGERVSGGHDGEALRQLRDCAGSWS